MPIAQEVARADGRLVHADVVRDRWPSLDLEIAAHEHRRRAAASSRRRHATTSGSADSLSEHVLMERLQSSRRLAYIEVRRARRSARRRFPAESGIDRAQPQEALQHQAGAGQQHQRQRNLSNDERRAQPFLTGWSERAAATAASDPRTAALRDAQRRGEPERRSRSMSDTPSANARTQPSMRIISMRGIRPAGASASSAGTAQRASRMPHAPPASDTRCSRSAAGGQAARGWRRAPRGPRSRAACRMRGRAAGSRRWRTR